MDYPRRELSNGRLESVVTLLVRWQIVFLSAQTLALNPAVMASPSYGRLLRDQNGQKVTTYHTLRHDGVVIGGVGVRGVPRGVGGICGGSEEFVVSPKKQVICII